MQREASADKHSSAGDKVNKHSFSDDDSNRTSSSESESEEEGCSSVVTRQIRPQI